MEKHEFEADFERIKSEALAKISRANEKWRMVSQKAQGYPDAEIDLVHLKLELQIAETETLMDIEKMEEKIRKAAEDDPAAS
ncbi:hypothetical protein HZC34_05885 [Candidatus Saganbacteria bacterium]|nr:hypothetical protein [Candidatus Saganbacteria bacterium]